LVGGANAQNGMMMQTGMLGGEQSMFVATSSL
jgi:hypothetical protein